MTHTGQFKCRIRFCPLTVMIAALALLLQAAPASAQTGNCLQNEFNAAGFTQKLNCTANDVKIAEAVNPRDPQGHPISTCFAGTTFSFIADFQVVTTATSRENIGLYMATGGQSSALTGTCVDNIISPLHDPGKAGVVSCSSTVGTTQCLGSALYHEFDAPPDNCGDTTSADGTSQFVTIAVNNILCPAVGTTFVLPNCTSWQQPGGTIQCVSDPSTGWPFVTAAVPGAPSKCNCSTITLPITPITVTATVAKSCNTSITTGTGKTSCDAGVEGQDPVTYHVAVTPTVTTGDAIIDQICDSQWGNVFTASGFTPACAKGSQCSTGAGTYCGTTPNGCSGGLTIPHGTTGTCDFTATVGELANVTDTVSVSGHSSISPSATFGPTTSNSVNVFSEDAPSTAKVIKGVVGTQAACATVRYSVEVDNTSGFDETEMLSKLNDSAYGDITTVGTGTGRIGSKVVLGTTCGVATGQGTLSGAVGAGTLPATITATPAGNYTCQFDGQFCSGLDPSGCISQSDTVTATLQGDETGDKTFGTASSQITVKECLTTTVTSP